MNHYFEAFLRLFFPTQCGCCDKELDLEENVLCRDCGRLLASGRNSFLEGCFEPAKPLDSLWALYPYEPPVKDILAAVKFRQKPWLLKGFETSFGNFYASLSAEVRHDVIIPVPLGRRRLMERGFNQSELLARMAGRPSRVPVACGVLKKRPGVGAQHLLSREERSIQMEGAFTVADRRFLRGKSVLLVDDVTTTGATACEAASTLKEAGARRVDFMALARTPENTGTGKDA